MNKKLLLLLPALAMVLAGCNNKKSESSAPQSSSADPNAVTAVEVSPASKTLEAGETVQLEATVKPFSVANKEVNWSSDNEAKATVNASGLVTTYEAGTVHIKATSQADTSKSGQSTLTILPANVYYAEPEPDTEKTFKFGTYQVGLSQRIFFNGQFENYPRGKTAEGYDNGVDVKFEAGPNSGEWYVTYMEGTTKKYLGMSDTHRFGAEGTYEDSGTTTTITHEQCVWKWDAELKTITRKISDKTYFPGTYNNYATISGCDVTMASSDYIFQFITKIEACDPTSVSIVEATAGVYAGSSVQLHAECQPAGAQNARLTWTVEGNEKVHVDNHGLVTADEDAVVDSQATIKATWGDLPGDTCVVTVKEKLNYGTLEEPLTIAQAKALLDKQNPTEQPLFVKGVVTSSGAYTSYNNWDPIWLASDDLSEEKAFEGYRLKDGSSDGSLKTTYAAANSLYGKTVTICGIGKIYSTTYETDGGADSKLMKVEDIAIPATGITLNPNTAFELEKGAEKAVSAKLAPFGASGTVNWTVAPSGQGVTYEDGKVKATSEATAGEYTLTASVADTSPEVKASVTFTVVAPAGTKYTLDVSDAGWPTTAEETATAHTIGGVAVMTCGLNKDTSGSAQAGGDIFMKKGAGYLYNTASLGKITSIKVTFSANSSAGKYVCISLGSSALSARDTDNEHAYTFEKSGTIEVTNSTDGVGYFNVSNNQGSSGKNIRIVSIVIVYEAA